MKKIFAFVSLLVLAVACAAPPTNRDLASETNKTTNLAAEKPAPPALSEADAIAREKSVWEAIKNKDYDGFSSMLADNQVEVLGEGVFDKAASLATVKDFEPSEINFSDWKYLPVNKNVVLLTYTVNVKGKYKGREIPPDTSRASSAWVNHDGKWLAMYHQSTSVKPPPPPPAAKTPAKEAAASPAPAAPAEVVIGSDPVSNEKAIWGALAAKNYDGFAAALSADALDVESVGVFDKAATLKAVAEFDFSKAELSDFKTTSLDNESVLVTYVVKFPAPAPAERHSTIWSKRDGKWLAVFHQGTEAPQR